MSAPLPINEPNRLEALRSFQLETSEPDPVLDRITATAGLLLRAPVALITLIDENRQWFKSAIGVPYTEVSREEAICAYAILSPEGLAIADTWEDPRFAEKRRLHGRPWLRSYAGVPLMTAAGEAIGTLCILDLRPRPDFNAQCLRELTPLAQEAMAHIEARRAALRLSRALRAYRADASGEAAYCRIATTISDTPDAAKAWQAMLEELGALHGWGQGCIWGPDAKGALTPLAAIGDDAPPCRGELVDTVWKERQPRHEPESDGLHVALTLPSRDEGGAVVLEFTLPGVWEEAALTAHLQSLEPLARRLVGLLERKGNDDQLRRHEAELSRANHNKDHFLAMLAHELRNPLAPILNAVSLLRSPDPGDAVEIIERQVRHMARLMEDLLDISRITQGKLLLRRRGLDLRVPVRAALRAASDTIANRGQVLHHQLPEVPVPMEADPVRIEQIIANLLNNASKYTPGGGTISLELTVAGPEAHLRVSDTGMGLPEGMEEAIFEAFIQGPHPMAGSGLGIGLALVRQLVTLHGGKITARNNGEGNGCEFLIRLPLALPEEQPEPPALSQPASTAPEPTRRRRVLIVEDNRDLVATLARLLKLWGHEVRAVHRGEEALPAALEFRPEVALIDIGLPGGTDGHTIAQELGATPELAGITLLAVSGYHQEKDRRRAQEAGFHRYLLKPVDPEELRRQIEAP